MLGPLEDVISEIPTTTTPPSRRVPPLVAALPSPEDLYALPSRSRKSRPTPPPPQERRRRTKSPVSPSASNTVKTGEGKEKRLDQHKDENATSATSSSASTSSSLSTMRLLTGDDTNRLPTFQRSTEELHHRIQGIEKALRGAGKGLRARDDTISRLQKEIEFLRSIVAHRTRPPQVWLPAAPPGLDGEDSSPRLNPDRVGDGGGSVVEQVGSSPQQRRIPVSHATDYREVDTEGHGYSEAQHAPNSPYKSKKKIKETQCSMRGTRQRAPRATNSDPSSSSRSSTGSVRETEGNKTPPPQGRDTSHTIDKEGGMVPQHNRRRGSHAHNGGGGRNGQQRRGGLTPHKAAVVTTPSSSSPEQPSSRSRSPVSGRETQKKKKKKKMKNGEMPRGGRVVSVSVLSGSADRPRRPSPSRTLTDGDAVEDRRPGTVLSPSPRRHGKNASSSARRVERGMRDASSCGAILANEGQANAAEKDMIEEEEGSNAATVATGLLSALNTARLQLAAKSTIQKESEESNVALAREREKVRELTTERQQLQEEVAVWRRTVAELLALLSEVPALRGELEQNDLLLLGDQSDMVYVGEPRRPPMSGSQKAMQEKQNGEVPLPISRDPHHAINNNSNRHHHHHHPNNNHLHHNNAREKGDNRYQSVSPRRLDSPGQRRGSPAAKGVGKQGSNPNRIIPQSPWVMDQESRISTGVENGVYVGTASVTNSKNIWLNGKWIEQIQQVLATAPLLLSTGLPQSSTGGARGETTPMAVSVPSFVLSTNSNGDVLRSRDAQKDYWIPLDVFKASQAFKDQFFPSLPVSLFLPYLHKLNSVWKGKMERKLQLARHESQRQVAERERVISSLSQELEALRRQQARHQQDRVTADRITQIQEEMYGPKGMLCGDSVIGRARQRSLAVAQRVATRDHTDCSSSSSSGDGGACGMFREVQQSIDALRRRIQRHATSPSALYVAEQYEEMVSILLSLCAIAVGEGGLQDEEKNRKRGQLPTAPASPPPPSAPSRVLAAATSHGAAKQDRHSRAGMPVVRVDDDHFGAEEEEEETECDDEEEEEEEEIVDYENSRTSSSHMGTEGKAAGPTRRQARSFQRHWVEEEEETDSAIGPVVERLLCVVQHTCDGVLQVAAEVENNTAAATRDLTRFLSQLRQVLGEEEEEGEEGYSTSRRNALGPITPLEGDVEVRSPDTRQTRGSMGSESSRNSEVSGPAKQYRVTLFHVIESVLDYSEDVLAEVKKATNELQLLTHCGIKEAERSIQ